MTLKKFLDMNTNIDLSYVISYNYDDSVPTGYYSDEKGKYMKFKEFFSINQIDTEFLLSNVLDFFIRDDMTLCVGIDYYE